MAIDASRERSRRADRQEDPERILERLVQLGDVIAVDEKKHAARVKFPETGIISGWLKIIDARPYAPDYDEELADTLNREPESEVVRWAENEDTGEEDLLYIEAEAKGRKVSTVDINSLPMNSGYINGSNVWKGTNGTSYKHFALPVKGGEDFKIETNGNNFYYCVVTDYATPQNDNAPQFSTETGYTGRISTADQKTGTLPSDAKYLVAVVVSGNTDMMPASLVIGGYEYQKNAKAHIEKLSHTHEIKFRMWLPKIRDRVVCLYLPVRNGDGFILGKIW